MADFTTFSEYRYGRPDMEAVKVLLRAAKTRVKRASSGEEVLAVYDDVHKVMQQLDTLKNVCEIRNSLDTTDDYYERELAYLFETLPLVEVALQDFQKVVLDSPYLDAVQDKYGELYVQRMRKLMKLVNEANVENQVEEKKLVQKYHRTAAEPVADFHGEKLNFYGLLKKMQDTDREVRKEALAAWAKLYESIADTLNDIYTQLIENRTRQAEVLGFKDYTEMMYLAMERFDYDREDVAGYREKIRKYIVPVVSEIYKKKQAALGLEHLYYYDEAVTSLEGNPCPQGTTEELLDYAQQMYSELSAETGAFFEFMRAHELFDLETRPGKQQGGYCTFLSDMKAPFIFSNFNGTSSDIETLTHEAGHAFEAYSALHHGVPEELAFSTSEVAEIHSITMEFLTHPWMHLFFGDKTQQYLQNHLHESLQVIPYMACVDEFQHVVYDKHMTDADARYELWHALEEKYMPWRDYGDCDFLKQGGFWMQKQHIFMCPFYYIDYSLASMGAFEYYLRSLEDSEAAWKDYYALCCAGGSKGYKELLKLGHLSDPFAEDTVKDLMQALSALI